jgi:predicted DNA-binding antitoxin AbrB/MazE fold protein
VSYTGEVQNGVVVLLPDVKLPEGAEVEVVPRSIPQGANASVEGMLKLAKPRDWPEDFALNHGHYIKGHPKKS